MTRLFLILSLLHFSAFSQSDSIRFFQPDKEFNSKRFYFSSGTIGVGAVSSLVVLNEVWYKGYPRSPLHTFNDNDEWLMMDKIGHTTTTYTVGYVAHNVLRWSGVEEKKAIWYGVSVGLAYLTCIEVLDGLSSQWGFSVGDMVANTTGASLYISQQLLWNEQRIRPKFSVHLSPYAQYRPNVLGSSTAERWLKDYNGQTYWMSVNVASFLSKDTKVPQWLNIAFGYGGEEMLKGDLKYYTIVSSSTSKTFTAYRQYYLSLDIDLTKIKTKSHFLKTVLGTINYLKIPFPALEFSQNKIKGHLFYF